MTDEFELDLSHLVVKPSAVNKPELIVLYGPPGGGKSYLAASISEVEDQYPVLILDTEGSTAGTLATFDDERIDILKVDTAKQFDQIIRSLTTKTHKYKTVIVDTFDVAQDRAIKPFLDQNAGNTFAGWGQLKEWTIDTARALKAAPFLSILVFHETIEKNEHGANERRLVLAGSAKETMPGIPDVVGLVTRKANKDGSEVSTVQFAPSPSTATKNRFQLPARMEGATMSGIFEEIQKNKREEIN